MLDVGSAATAREVGEMLARSHLEGRTLGPSLHEYIERPHVDGWTLRSALVRYAQPEPVRAAAVLDLTRRTGSGLEGEARRIEREPHLSDLARARHRWSEDWTSIVDAYAAEAPPLDDADLDLIEVLAVAAALDELGATMVVWAVEAGDDRPDDEVDRTCRFVHRRLGELGVEAKEWYR